MTEPASPPSAPVAPTAAQGDGIRRGIEFTVSVIMPTYNAETLVARALHSAATQEGVGPVEIVVCDDASGDGTVAELFRLAAEIPHMRIFENSANAGPAARRNQGIAAARGRWIAVLDADDAYAPGRLARLVRLAEADGFDVIADLPLLYDLTAGEPEPDQPCTALGPQLVELEDLIDPTARKGIDLGWLKPIFHHRLVDDGRWHYPETVRHGEDFELYFNLLSGGVRFALLGEAHYLFSTRVGAISRVRSRGSVTRLDFTGLVRQAEARAAELSARADVKPALVAMMHQRARNAQRANRVHGWSSLRRGEWNVFLTWLRHDPRNLREFLRVLGAKLKGHRGMPD